MTLSRSYPRRWYAKSAAPNYSKEGQMADPITQENETEHPGIKPEMKEDWKKYVDDAIANDPGEPRNYALLILAQVSALIKGLHQGLAPIEVIKLVQPNTTFIMMSPLLQAVCAFSVRGEEFRMWWNEWHDRVCPGDVTDIPVDQMNPIQRKDWDQRWLLPVKDAEGKVVREEEGKITLAWQPPIFNPWQMNIVGRVAQLQGAFDPSQPLTKTPQYMESVNALYKKFKEEAKTAGATA